MGPRTTRIVVAIAAGFGLVAGGVLYAAALSGSHAPGCGPGGWLSRLLGPTLGGGCAALSSSPWASLPFGIPVSALALAYFVAAVVAVSFSVPASARFRWASRLAAAASLLYIAVSWHHGLWCFYCLTCHGSSIAIWLALERASTPCSSLASTWTRSLSVFGVAFALLSALSIAFSSLSTSRQDAEQRDVESRLRAGSHAATRFAGRFTLGPIDAKARVVVFLGYQCPECQRVEQLLDTLRASTPGMSVSIRHFPFCTDCNRLVPTTHHAHGCRAAAAVEAAGILGGPDAFARLHRWLLMDSNASKPDADYAQAAGLPLDTLLAAMNDPRVADALRSDVNAAETVGLSQTPMMFINGIEFRTWNLPGALARAINAALASPDAISNDTPPDAASRAVSIWKQAPAVTLTAPRRTMGPDSAPVRVTLFGSYQDDKTAELDRLFRARADQGSIRYSYIHYPPDRACNPSLPRTVHPMACRMALAAESLGLAQDDAAFWSLHEWIFSNHRRYSDAALREFALSQAWPQRLPLRTGAAEEALARDIVQGKAAGVTEIPFLIINDRPATQWRSGERLLIDDLILAASPTAR